MNAEIKSARDQLAIKKPGPLAVFSSTLPFQKGFSAGRIEKCSSTHIQCIVAQLSIQVFVVWCVINQPSVPHPD
jgi:hypothetical protein